MADINTRNGNLMHFSGTGTNTVIFMRSTNSLLLTTTGIVSMSLDGGGNFLPITAGTYQFSGINVQRIFFTGGGTYDGIGLAY